MRAASPFILLAAQRSGSSWLADLLSAHPSIRMFAEVFLDRPRRESASNRNLLPRIRYFEFREPRSIPRPWVTWRYLDWLRDEADCDSIGFKLMYAQLLRLPEVMPHLRRRRFAVILLIRDNPLDVLISAEMMRQHRRVHTSAPLAAQQIHLVPDSLKSRLRRHLQHIGRVRAGLRILGMRVIEVHYEQLERETDRELTRIAEFLGLAAFPESASTQFVRVNRGSHRDKVANYAEVEAVLAGSSFQRFLN